MSTCSQSCTPFRHSFFLTLAVLLIGANGVTVVFAAPPQSLTFLPSVDTASEIRHPPQYPAKATQSDDHGMVILDITVDAVGHVKKIVVDSTGTTAPKVLQDAAVSAAAHWKFNPGAKNGRPVGGTLKVPLMFSPAYSKPFRPIPPASSASRSRSPQV